MPIFEIRMCLSFEREVFFIEPPTPLSPFDSPIPSVHTTLGNILFYFDEWEVIGDNVAGEPSSSYSTFFVHFIPENIPSTIESLFLTDDTVVANGLFWNSNPAELVALKNQITIITRLLQLKKSIRKERKSVKTGVGFRIRTRASQPHS